MLLLWLLFSSSLYRTGFFCWEEEYAREKASPRRLTAPSTSFGVVADDVFVLATLLPLLPPPLLLPFEDEEKKDPWLLAALGNTAGCC